MRDEREAKGLIEKKLEDPEYRKRFSREYEAFKIEAQILYTLERKGMTYEELAHATGTQKSNISRDLRAGGIFNASLSRISRIAEALGMRLVALLVPEESARFILPKIEDLVRKSLGSAPEGLELTFHRTSTIFSPIPTETRGTNYFLSNAEPNFPIHA